MSCAAGPEDGQRREVPPRKRLDAVHPIEVAHAQHVARSALRRRSCRDTLESRKPARRVNWRHDLGEVGGAPLQAEAVQMRPFPPERSNPLLFVAPGQPACRLKCQVIFNRCEVAAAAQDHCLINAFLRCRFWIPTAPFSCGPHHARCCRLGRPCRNGRQIRHHPSGLVRLLRR